MKHYRVNKLAKAGGTVILATDMCPPPPPPPPPPPAPEPEKG